MALNLATLRTRSLTAALFVVVMLIGLLWNSWSFFLLFTIVHFGCWAEYQRLISLIDEDYKTITPLHRYGVQLAGWCIVLFFTNDHLVFLGLKLHAVGWWVGLILVFMLPIIELLFSPTIQLKNIGYSALGLLYISLSWGLMMDLRADFTPIVSFDKDYGWIMPVVLIASIWINDTMAYIVGSLIGKTPFSKISPKKTWEGTAGGALLAVVAVTLVWIAIFPGSYWWHISIIAGLAAITGTAGDLLESKLKRLANVKDSGHFMPGHGGFLDRFDSLLLATPFVWLYITLFLK